MAGQLTVLLEVRAMMCLAVHAVTLTPDSPTSQFADGLKDRNWLTKQV